MPTRRMGNNTPGLLLLAVLLHLVSSSVAEAQQPAPDTAVVCASDLRLALSPWVEMRRRQGHTLAFVSTGQSKAQIRGELAQLFALGKLRYVVLVGDAPEIDTNASFANPATSRSIEPDTVAAVVTRRFGGEASFATDFGFADFDGDKLPDVAVGRLPAESPQEVAALAEKIVTYEELSLSGPWRRKVNFVAGVGGFGALADAAIEVCARQFITQGVPSSYHTLMTYASWRSPFCPDPRYFHETALARLNEGSLFWIYLGHGQRRGLDSFPGLRTPPILSVLDAPQLDCRPQAAPIALFISCFTGDFSTRGDCLAETLLKHPNGPVAVVAASGVTMPYGNAIFGIELMKACFAERRATLGDVFLQAKREMLSEKPKPEHAALNGLAQLITPGGADLKQERLEHAMLYNLLGDPLLRIPHVEPLEIQCTEEVTAGGKVEVSGTWPQAGQAHVELVWPRDRATRNAPIRANFPVTDAALTEFQQVYQSANNEVLSAWNDQVKPGTFSTTLDVPSDLQGKCQVRVLFVGQRQVATAAADIKVQKPQPSP